MQFALAIDIHAIYTNCNFGRENILVLQLSVELVRWGGGGFSMEMSGRDGLSSWSNSDGLFPGLIVVRTQSL